MIDIESSFENQEYPGSVKNRNSHWLVLSSCSARTKTRPVLSMFLEASPDETLHFVHRAPKSCFYGTFLAAQ